MKNGLSIFFVTVDVQFKNRPDLLDEDGKILRHSWVEGFMQQFGCTATDELMMKARVSAYIKQQEEDAPIEITFTQIGIIPEEDVQREVYEDEDVKDSLVQSPEEEGIWYRTGRGFYPEPPQSRRRINGSR